MNRCVDDASGTASLRVLPDGSITPSTYLVTGQWKRAHIRDARLDSPQFASDLAQGIGRDALSEACQACPLKEKCKGGPIDRRMIWYGTLQERDPYCPFRHNDTLESWQFAETIHQTTGPNIHDGYLPTLIFAPRQPTHD
jgi:radical SAM protein with 4Fe4S-binding SPASM domain